MKYNFDCVVIGSGIAGMTAAIYLKRANVSVLILDNDAPGGLLNKIGQVENYPGYIKISGPDLAYSVYEQVQNLDIEIRYGKVLEIKEHTIVTDIEEITANKIILAVGRSARKLENTNHLKNVSYCAVCDANLYKNKIVAVVGGSNAAIEESLYLSGICKKVLLLCRSENLKGEELLIEKIKNTSNIDLYTDCVIKTLDSKDNLLNNIYTNTGKFKIDGMFISIGYEPNTNFFEEIAKEDGYIIVNARMQTNIDYIYACGDIIKKDVYQLATAIGEAATAAINIKKSLLK